MKKFFKGVLMILIALIILACGLYFYARYIEPGRITLECVSVESGLVSRAVRIGTVADTHVGNGTDSAKVKKVFDIIAAENPDILVFLGDLYENYGTYRAGSEEKSALEEAFLVPQLEGVPKYAVFGNHDLGGRGEDGFRQLLESTGWTILVNESAQIDGNINIIGGDDAIFGNFNIGGLAREGMFNLLLVHEPDVADGVGGIQLQLSGHAHGGQVKVPFVGPLILPRLGEIYTQGMYEKADGGKIYVSRGLGMSALPFRFGSLPEVTVVDIIPAG